MLKVLLELCKSRSFASFYTDNVNTEKFIFGRVIALSESQIVIHSVSSDGEDDGIVLLSVQKVFRIEEKGQYSAKMHKLIGNRNLPEYPLRIDEYDVDTSVLLYAQRNQHIVSIELLDSGYDNVVGFVDVVDDGQCKIRLIDEYGCVDGFSYFYKEHISQISMLSQSEKRIEILWKANEEKVE